MPDQSILDARLAEIDRRLRTIQSGLLTSENPAPTDGAAPTSDRTAAAPAPVTPIRPPAGPAPPAPAVRDDDLADAGRLVAQLQQLTAAHERLLGSSRELLTGFADAVAATRPGVGTPEPVTAPEPAASRFVRSREGPSAGAAGAPLAAAPPLPTPVSVTAGPFADTAALRKFERSLSALPEVRDVSVREYIGDDRVVVEVHLSAPTS
jgi:hypothetical protein